MPSDNISKIESNKSANAGLTARGTLSWITRLINGSAQEISDFSALLSAQSFLTGEINKASHAKAVTPAENPNKEEAALVSMERKNCEISPKSQQVLSKNQDNATETLASCGVSQSSISQKEEESAQHDTEADQTEDQIDSQVSESSIETEGETQEVEYSCVLPEESQMAPVSLNAEMAAALLLDPKQVPTSEGENQPTEQSDILAQVVKPDTTALRNNENPEELPPSVGEDFIEHAKNFIKKDPSSIEKVQVNASQNSSKTSESLVPDAVSIKRDSFTSEFNESLAPTQVSVNIQASKTQQSTSLNLAESFVSSQIKMLSQNNVNAAKEVVHAEIEGLGNLKSVSTLSRTSNESGTGSGIQPLKSGAASNSGSERNAFSLNNSEQGSKNETTKGSKSLTRTQSLATLERVEAALQKASESKDGTQISLRLDPPNLGFVKVDVSCRDGLLHARISADSAQVLQLLREKAPELQVTLRKLGLDVDQVSVSVNSGDSGTFFESSDGKKGEGERKSGSNFLEMADSAAAMELPNLDHWIA